METLKRIFNVLYIIGFVWIVILGFTFSDGNSFFQNLSLIFLIGVVPVILLFFVRKAIVYIITGKK